MPNGLSVMFSHLLRGFAGEALGDRLWHAGFDVINSPLDAQVALAGVMKTAQQWSALRDRLSELGIISCKFMPQKQEQGSCPDLANAA